MISRSEETCSIWFVFFDNRLWREAVVSLLLIKILVIHQINTLIEGAKIRGNKTDHFAHLFKVLPEQDIDRASTENVVQKGIHCITSVAHTWLHLKIVNYTQCNRNILHHCALQCIIIYTKYENVKSGNYLL